ncbi:pro-sigmaK processing inhibitor BofA family protein [Anaerotignum sp.]|uniref:pro-sigmaK processing inhibitor BofA family protein n=1 Tax=Anaerotignum sp. TaxID=2039241 RepID=UPI002714A52C|nr:pro-sigmaK processing inhibitor BofA family protein [Anaerotignum sp.]
MTNVLAIIIVSCLLILALATLAKPLRIFFRFILSAAVGGCCLWLCNRFGLQVGVNPATVCTVGLLGAPGFVGLLVLSFFL